MSEVQASTVTPSRDGGASGDGSTTAPGSAAASGSQGVDPTLLGSLAAALVGAGGLAACGRSSALALLVGVAVVQAAFAVSWVFGTGMPGRKGALVIAAMAAAGADVTVSVWPHARLGTLLAVLGLSVPVMFVHQLSRGAARTRLVASLSGVAVAVLGVVALPALIQLRHEFADSGIGGVVAEAVAAVIGAALVVAYLVDVVVPVPRFDPDVPRGMLALLAAAGVGAAVGYLVLREHADFADGRSVFVGAALGALASLLSVAASFVLHSSAEPVVRVGAVLRPVAAALLPLCLLAPGAFLLCLAIRA